MLKLYNTLGRKIETFRPVNRKRLTIFTCGPSVYQRAHIGNFRTFLFEDILARYLEYTGYPIVRGMNLTDIEDKAIREAQRQETTLRRITERNIRAFIREMDILRMKIPDYLAKASESVHDAAAIIEKLLRYNVAYRHGHNIYFDPLKFPGFGKLYGLDTSNWPSPRKRFHKDTYPGTQWNRGDFVLWHGYTEGDRYYWDTRIGRGRPSWNIQDASIISGAFCETLSIYCGGIDNLFRHHDYTLAILESIRPYPMAKFWLHCNHLFVNGRKMSKSKGNILYTDDLREMGYNAREIRFFLIYGQYREKMDYSEREIQSAAGKLRVFRRLTKKIAARASRVTASSLRTAGIIEEIFARKMDNDLNVRDAFDSLYEIVSGLNLDDLRPAEARGITETLKKIDEVLMVIY